MVLYSIEANDLWPDTALERFYQHFGDGEPLDPPPSYAPQEAHEAAYRVRDSEAEIKAYATRLVEGVCRKREALDRLLESISHHWRLDRMAYVDKNVLRMAAFEMTELKDLVPRKVAINEAIEVAKRFGSSESRAFVNGILDRIGKSAL